MITADGGGSNGPRLWHWTVALQQVADETGLVIQVRHYQPGPSKWVKIERRMVRHITQNWRAKPLTDRPTANENSPRVFRRGGCWIDGCGGRI